MAKDKLTTVPSYTLSARATVRDLLERFDLRADKAFGQNFLVDAFALATIVQAAELSKTDYVIEVGPGLGVLTQELAKTGAKVTALELDERLLPVLSETLAAFENVKVIHTDALHYPYSGLPEGSVLVANLPYNVATPIVMKALASERFKRLVFLVQKEVAERLTASPSSKAYGALTVVVKHFGVAKRVKDIKPTCFTPEPSVLSSIVQITVNKNAKNNPSLFDFIHQLFRYRRKTLRKNLRMAGFTEPTVSTTLLDLGINDKLRAEALELEHFEQLFKALG